VIDYRNLKYLVSLGVEVSEVHDIVSYEQSQWLKEYIDFNTKMRKDAKNEFERDFYKLMNNSVFGKTMENVRNRMKMHITTSEDNAKKWFSKPTFKNCIEGCGIYMIEMYKDEVVLDKPIYVGTTILDLSKLEMMKFHYGVIERDFKGKYLVLYSDTDSLVYLIFTDDVYDWMKTNNDLFDLSGSLRPDMKDDTNDKVLGKMKDELHCLPIETFISLNPKVYSYTVKDKIDDRFLKLPGVTKAQVDKKVKDNEVKKLKGVSKATVKNNITNSDYKKVLDTGESESRHTTSIRSFNHQLHTIRQNKLALTSYYDKMQMLDNINCVPFGFISSEAQDKNVCFA
jgi:hypothetical protein